MNEPENIQNDPRSADLNEQCEDLRRQVNLLFGGLIVVSITLTVYLGVQLRRAGKDLAAILPHAEQAVRTIQQDDASAQVIFEKLTEFGRTHADFRTNILANYKISWTGTNAPKK
jgi:hypothetical protein